MGRHELQKKDIMVTENDGSRWRRTVTFIAQVRHIAD